jgi:hypothetical protein
MIFVGAMLTIIAFLLLYIVYLLWHLQQEPVNVIPTLPSTKEQLGAVPPTSSTSWPAHESPSTIFCLLRSKQRKLSELKKNGGLGGMFAGISTTALIVPVGSPIALPLIIVAGAIGWWNGAHVGVKCDHNYTAFMNGMWQGVQIGQSVGLVASRVEERNVGQSVGLVASRVEEHNIKESRERLSSKSPLVKNMCLAARMETCPVCGRELINCVCPDVWGYNC